MKKSNFKILLFLTLFLGQSVFFAQTTKDENLSFEEIEIKIDSLQNENAKALKLINIYINKAKRENNEESLFYAYRYASKYYSTPTNFKYADSVLIVAKKSKNIKLLTEAYLNSGTIYMDKQFYQKALDNILIANKYSIELKDDYITNKTIYSIAQNRIYLGNYEEANAELKVCLVYFKNNLNDKTSLGKNSQLYYIYSLISYLDTNTKIGKQYENKALIDEVEKYLKSNNLDSYLPYFVSIEGTDAYYRKDYTTAIRKLKEALNLYDDQWSHNTEVFYLGLANWKLGNHAVAVKYLEEIDKEYEKKQKLDPQFRSAYELLIKYNDSIGNTKKQLTYINKLMFLDRSYEKNFKYLYSKINKEYDTQKLLAEKSKIEATLELRTYVGIFLILLVAVLTYFGFRQYQQNKIYKARFEDIVNEKHKKSLDSSDIIGELSLNKSENSFDAEYHNKIPGLKPLFVYNILNQLKAFEEEKRFTDSQLSIKLLSENFGTNYVYLSKIINEYRGTNFNIYINDLRLDYAVDLLKDKKYLDYDIKKLACISGFATANSFSSNFVRKFKIKPSYFIKLLRENV